MKYATFLTMIVILIGAASAASFEVKSKCDSDQEVLFSIYSKDGGNAGMPGFYDHQICAEGVSNAGFYQSCPDDTNEILSFYKKNDSHVSTFSSYNWKLCAADIQTSINNSCSSENIVASVKSKDDTHVAAPDHYTDKLCGKVTKPENVTVEMELNSEDVYVDGELAEKRRYLPLEVSYPYIVTGQPLGIVGNGEFSSLEYSETSGIDVFRVTQERGSFLIPNTKGRYGSVEDEESVILEKQFLELIEPSFGFETVERPSIRIGLSPEVNITGFNSRRSGSIQLYIRNRYSNESAIDIGPVQ